jgi:phospholipid/cholesterol/gamma-HCH transport system substrate-binding protein
MSRTERREYLVGVLAALILGTILVFTALANRRALNDAPGSFNLIAEFSRADGVYVGTPVRLAGIAVGSVIKADLNEGHRAMLTFRLNRQLALPEDTAAVVETDGVFGTKHIELQPGGAEETLKPGARMSYTQDSVIIEDLIAHIVQEAKATRAQAKADAAP